MSNKCHIKNTCHPTDVHYLEIWIYIRMPLNSYPQKILILYWVQSIKQRDMHRDLCILLWSKWQMSMHFYTSMQIRMLMSWKRTMSIFSHNHSISFFLLLCFTLTYKHTNNAGTAWNKQSMLGFFVHRIHGRMLEKTFIKGFNTSRVFSWRISFWTNTYTGDIYKCLWRES